MILAAIPGNIAQRVITMGSDHHNRTLDKVHGHIDPRGVLS